MKDWQYFYLLASLCTIMSVLVPECDIFYNILAVLNILVGTYDLFKNKGK